MVGLDTVTKRPNACQDPSLSDYLPTLIDKDVDQIIPVGIASTQSPSALYPTVKFRSVSPFARSAQGAYLASLVNSHVSCQHLDQDCEIYFAEGAYLDTILRAFAISAMDQAQHDRDMGWASSCGAHILMMRFVNSLPFTRHPGCPSAHI